MSIEQLLADHTAALHANTAAIAAHTAALGGEAPKKTRGLAKKDADPTPAGAVPVASVTVPAAASAPISPSVPAVTAPSVPTATLKDVSDKFTTLARVNRAAAVAILAEFGVERLSMIKPDKLGTVLAKVEAASAPAPAAAPVAESLI